MIKEISNEDRAYFAGLLDGEGTIRVHKFIKGNYIGYGLEVSFKITYKKVLIEMQKVFSGNIYKTDMDVVINSKSSKRRFESDVFDPKKWKQSYAYKLNGRDALYFLKVVEPFCREKKEQAAVGIRYEQGRRSHAGRYGRSDSETKRCEFFYKELKKMKHEPLDENENETDFKDDQQKLFSFVEEN